ncbi:MAG: DUF1566 domain-containing protein [Bacteroidetes bacterium]|nr:DUF1566 domain-containing protein [Bacteroidota bacterium]
MIQIAGLLFSLSLTLISCEGLFADDDLIADQDSLGVVDPIITKTYPIVDTGTEAFYNNSSEITESAEGQSFYGQDAHYRGNEPSYTDNGDGTITDLVSGLMWTKEIDDKITFDQAVAGAISCNVGGFTDWRLPTIKELYSLILFSGTDPSGGSSSSVPFLDDEYFDFRFGDESAGERLIDAQYWSSTEYVSTTMGGDATVFGVNFADGRIKGYPKVFKPTGSGFTEFVRYVRGNALYGINDFADQEDSSIVDQSTGLMWMQFDSGELKAGNNNDGTMNWEEALEWAENLEFAGHDDWRLPDAKELQSIVDYSRSPATTGSPAIDPVFSCTEITNEIGQKDWAFYWSSTTHTSANGMARNAAYVSFGEASGFMEMPPNSGNYNFTDVHGAGAQRSDPKVGDPSDYPYGHGPQGDVIRIYNMVRCVRSVK